MRLISEIRTEAIEEDVWLLNHPDAITYVISDYEQNTLIECIAYFDKESNELFIAMTKEDG